MELHIRHSGELQDAEVILGVQNAMYVNVSYHLSDFTENLT